MDGAFHRLLATSRGRLRDQNQSELPIGSSAQPADAMVPAIEVHRPYALVSLDNDQPLYVTCACRGEIRDANRRLWQGGLLLRYVPLRQQS
jgi:hypothetical protein